MTTSITKTSTLRSLAELIEAINQDWPTDSAESAMNKAIAESKLLQVVGATINRDLSELDSNYHRHTNEALRELAIELAVEENLRTSPDQMVQLNDADIMRTLLRPIPPAVILERVAMALDAEVPDIVKRAARMLHTAD